MNKKLLALAIAAALAPAAALADGGNVKITGNMHVSLDSLDTGTSSNTNVSSNSSWIRFSGDESLGNGLKAIWQVESLIPLDDYDTASFATRNSFAGLNGGFGTVIMGKHDTPMKLVGRSVDLFGDQIGDSRNIIAGTNSSNMFDLRPQNVVAYLSPEFSGFSGAAAYVTNLDNSAATDASVTAYSLSAKYATGPFMVAGAYESHDLGTVDRDSYRLAAGFTFGDFKVVGMYQSQRDIVAVGTQLEDQDAWGLGGAYKMGAFTIKGQYYQADDVDNVNNSGANLFALGLDYSLSKRTTAYLAYAQTDNDAAANYTAFGGGHGDNPGVVVGDTGRGYSLGMIHKF